MANTSQSGTLYIDATGSITSSSIKVSYILYTSSSAGDTIVLRDGTSSGSPLKFNIKNPTATNTMVLDFSDRPVIFQNGLYVSAISSSSIATIVTTSGEA